MALGPSCSFENHVNRLESDSWGFQQRLGGSRKAPGWPYARHVKSHDFWGPGGGFAPVQEHLSEPMPRGAKGGPILGLWTGGIGSQ